MKNIPSTVEVPAARQDRLGATLTEVLMAILIMGIGMIGVISLFPAAVLRSVQAHALTTSANLRYNAEASLALYPHILANPERAAPFPLGATQYHQQRESVFMVDPLGLLNHAIIDGTPLGGNGTQTLRRYSAGFTSLTTAEEVFSCADKWTTRYEGFPASGAVASSDSPQTLTFPAGKLSSQQVYPGPAGGATRCVIFNKTGDRCEVRDVLSTLSAVNTSPLSDTIGWSKTLPGTFSAASLGAADIGNVRVEQRELTFTWLLTAKRQSKTVDLSRYSTSIALFHKRSYSPTDTVVYSNNGGNVFTKGLNVANITITPGNSPFLKRGSYVLDASLATGNWYRIQDYVESGTTARLTLESPATATSKAAVFMKGIVAVFRINDTNIDTYPVGCD